MRNQNLVFKLQAYNPNDIDETDVEEKIFLAKIEEVDLILEDVIAKVDRYFYEFPGTTRRQFLENLSQKALSDVRSHKLLIKAKVSEIKRNMTSSSTAPLVQEQLGAESDLKRREVEAMERANALSESRAIEARRNEREKCVLKAKSIYDNVKEDIQKLDDKINKVEVDEWSDEEDNSISKGMRNLDKWEGELKEITNMFRKLKDLKTTYNIEEDEVNYAFLEREVIGMEKVFIEVKEKLETEDEERGLYSMDKAKTSKVNLPTFSGKDSEDFSKFQADMEDGFKTNRVSRKEQIHKLRECVKGQARKLIPDSNVTDVSTAWEQTRKKSQACKHCLRKIVEKIVDIFV